MSVETDRPAESATSGPARTGDSREGRDRRFAPEPTDEALLEQASRAQREANDALATLYDRHQSAAYALALRMTGHSDLAEDVLQEAFLGAWRNAARYSRERGSVRTWLLAIVRHRAIDAIRSRGARPDTRALDAAHPEFVVPDVWPEVARRLDREHVVRALADLPEIQREAIELAYFGGLTQTEIAERTGAPLGTVKTRVRNGLLALRRRLERPLGRDHER